MHSYKQRLTCTIAGKGPLPISSFSLQHRLMSVPALATPCAGIAWQAQAAISGGSRRAGGGRTAPQGSQARRRSGSFADAEACQVHQPRQGAAWPVQASQRTLRPSCADQVSASVLRGCSRHCAAAACKCCRVCISPETVLIAAGCAAAAVWQARRTSVLLWSLHLLHKFHVAQPAQAPGQACPLAQRRLQQVGGTFVHG